MKMCQEPGDESNRDVACTYYVILTLGACARFTVVCLFVCVFVADLVPAYDTCAID